MCNLYLIFSNMLVLITLFDNILAECGCNKIKRSDFKNPTKEIEEFDTNFVKNDISCGHQQCSASANDPQILQFAHDEMVKIAEGDYLIGTNEPQFLEDNEPPERSVHVNQFYIDKYEVSNAEFSKFVTGTGYVTNAEKFGDSFVFEKFLSEEVREKYKDFRALRAPWWYKINNTFWRQPEGEGSSINDRKNHPVVHVSWIDATAFCEFKNKRLPTEQEWEVACRGGKKSKLFPWGNKLTPRDQHWSNIWQGKFPDGNTAEDGFLSTCPINRFHQNDYGLYNIVGNVWEWTSSPWNDKDLIRSSEHLDTVERVKKGGSYLCHKSYCYRYRCAARSSNTADSSAGNLGFRCARS